MQVRIAARTLGGPVNGDVIHVHGVSALRRRTVSADVVWHLSMSVLYFAAAWSVAIGGS